MCVCKDSSSITWHTLPKLASSAAQLAQRVKSESGQVVSWAEGPKPGRFTYTVPAGKMQGQSQCTHAPQQNRGKLYRSRSPHVHAHVCTRTLGSPGIEPSEHRLTLSVKIEGHVLPLHNDRPLAPSLSSPPTLVRFPRVQSLDLLLQQQVQAHTARSGVSSVRTPTGAMLTALASSPCPPVQLQKIQCTATTVWHSRMCARGLTSATRVHGSQPLRTAGLTGMPAPPPTMVGTCSTRFGPGCQATMAIARWMALVSGGRPASAPVLYVSSTKPCASSFSNFVQSCT